MVRLKEKGGILYRLDKAIFQFHYGTIKRQTICSDKDSYLYFNSTMVRLKESERKSRYKQVAFQFHYGTIKRDAVIGRLYDKQNFNSTMVRLKVKKQWEDNKVYLFQFHYGTIKSKFAKENGFQGFVFQFHYGTIKSKFAKENGFQGFVFQFHYGTIKRILRHLSIVLYFLNFNSTMVRLKAGHKFRIHNFSVISIPLWYD